MTDSNSKNTRLRSPAYPYLDLEEAIEKLELFHSIETFHHVPASVAATDIGYKDGSNRGWRALSSMTSFGLLDEEGTKENRQVWLSDLGKEIVAFGSKDSPDAKKAIRTAALKPTIHAELWDLWLTNAQALPSDETMKRYLLKDKAFNPQAVDSFIQEFRDTLSYAGLIKDGKIASSNSFNESRSPNSGTLRNRTNTGERMSNNNLQDYPIPLLGGSTAILSIPRPLSKQNLDLIKSFLTMYEPSLTEGSNTSVRQEDENSKNDK